MIALVVLLLMILAPTHAMAQVPYERLKAAETDPSNWLTYSGNYKSHRFSPLNQINRQNVTQLKPAWVYQVRQAGIVETSPIVVDGVMYVTEPPSTVTALDVRTGRPLWTLYTCSLLALDPADGRIKWHFQFTPHDVHDWDANQIPVLFDDTIGGRPRKLVAMANRNGFYYVLDRQTGAFVAGAPYVKQTWAKGLDAKGRPIVIPGSEPTTEAPSSGRASRARRIGTARPTARRRSCSTTPRARWARST